MALMVLTSARALLVIVFAFAAVSKLRYWRSTSVETVAFVGSDSRVVRFLARTLPFVELSCAGVLAGGVDARVGGGVALALLVLFTGVVIRNLRNGNRTVCACFGARSPIGGDTVVRNVGLVVVAVGIVLVAQAHRRPPTSPIWAGAFAGGRFVASLIVAVSVLSVYVSIRGRARLQAMLDSGR